MPNTSPNSVYLSKHFPYSKLYKQTKQKNAVTHTSSGNITQFPYQDETHVNTYKNVLYPYKSENDTKSTSTNDTDAMQLSMFAADSTEINPISYEQNNTFCPTYNKGKAPHQKTLPIKDKNLVHKIYEVLIKSGRYGKRNAAIFTLQVMLGRRTSDILRLRVEDIYDYRTNTIRDKITLKESKTGKMAIGLAVDDYNKEILDAYIHSLKIRSPRAYLFPSQKKNPDGTQRPINTTSLNEIYKANTEAIFRELNLPDQTHMSSYHARKTYGYRMYHTYVNSETGGIMENGIHVLDFLQALYNHKDQITTLRYIGAWEDVGKDTANKIAERYAMSQELKDLMKS